MIGSAFFRVCRIEERPNRQPLAAQNVGTTMNELSLVPVLWSRLPDIDDVEPVSENDGPVLEALRKVLTEHNALDRFGITLLHRHFSLAEGEVLVESTDRETRTQTVEVRPASEVFDGGRLLGTQWAFD